MYKLAFQTLKKNIALFGFLVGLLVVMEQFFEINAGVQFVMGASLALFSHRMILLDENYGAADLFKRSGPSGQKPPMLSFFLVSGIGFVVFLLLLGVTFYLLFHVVFGANLDDKAQLAGALYISIIPAAGGYGIVLSLIGTVFPAVAIGADRGLKIAFQRGELRFWKTLGRLAIGPFALSLLGLVGLVSFAGYLELAGFDISRALVDIPLSVLAYSINFGSLLLGVTALSMAYQEAEIILDDRD
ncbi:hypothetical protein JI58_04220 [Marinosulfonomonas sp. PRT-SC04]|nr:hypothetical protein JI58_04220 [Marinosulfonomonas sp. PRT-SC04]